ncbi:MAG: DUF4112 domain-containing protein [Micavibrio sp.]
MNQKPAPHAVYEAEAAEIERLEWLAHLMDSAFIIPGTNQTVGLDAIIGLVPVLGDTLAALVSIYIMRRARKLGATRILLARMGWNVFVDWLVGLVPFAGDAFDAAWKANKKM